MSFKKISILILIFFMQFFSKSVFALQTSSYTFGQTDVNGNPVAGATIANNTYTSDRSMQSPQGMWLDTTLHKLFVADSSQRRVMVYNLNSNNTPVDRIADNVLGQPSFRGGTAVATQSTTILPTSVLYVPSLDMLFVGDFSGNRVLVYANIASSGITDGMNATYVLGQTSFTTSTAGSTASTMSGPSALAYDTTTKTLLVADYTNGRIMGFDLSSGTVSTGMSASYVLGQTSLGTPTTSTCSSTLSRNLIGVAVDVSGRRVFASDPTCHRVVGWDISGGLSSSGITATIVLGQPNLTTSTTNTAAGFANGTCNSGTTNGCGMSAPRQLTYDATNNRLFVNDLSDNRTVVYTTFTNGVIAANAFGQTLLTTSSAAANSNGTGLGGPISSGYDEVNGYLYILNFNYHRITFYDLSAGITGNNMAATDLLGQLDSSDLPVYTQTALQSATVRANGMNTPIGAVIDPDHHYMFVSDANNNRVLVYTLTSDNVPSSVVPTYYLGQATSTGSSAGSCTAAGLSTPLGLDYDSVHKRLFVADFAHKRVMIYDLSSGVTGNNMSASYALGKADLTTTCSTATVSATNLVGPTAVAYNSVTDKLYVTDYSANRLVVYNLASIGSGLTAENVLGQCDFTSSSTNITLSGSCTGSGMNTPYGVTVDSTNSRLIVADSGNNRVLIYSLTSIANGAAATILGQASSSTNSVGTTASTMSLPRGVAWNQADQLLYVAEVTNNRVLIFDLSGGVSNFASAFAVLGQDSFTTATALPSQNGINGPTHIYFDSVNRRLYVVQTNSHRVDSFDILNFSRTQPSGTKGTAYTSAISSLSSLSSPAFFLVSGSLPPGLSISGSNFVGTPTVSTTYSFVLRGQTFLSDPSTYTFTIDDPATVTTTTTRRTNISVPRAVPVVGGVNGTSSIQGSIPSPSITTNTSAVFNNGVNITGYAVATKPDFSDSVGIVPFSFGTQKNLTIPRKSVIQYIKFYSSTGDATQPVVVPAVEKNITTSCSYARTLSIGSRGNDVRCIQEKLGIKNDGIFGKQVSSTIKSYQKKKGVKQTGVVDKKLWNMIVR